MNRFCLFLLSPPSIEEKLLDLLMDAVGEEVFMSAHTRSHGTSRGRMSNVEQVLGRSDSIQVQVLVDEQQMTTLVARLQDEFRGVGLRYWASPLAIEGEIE